MRKVLDQASTYFHHHEAIIPNQQAILFPAQKICVTYNNHPIVSHLDIFLQESECKGIREEYFESRMGIMPTSIPHIDTYAIARVIQRTKPYRSTYSKIMHRSLNTMTINHKWKLGDPICPFCRSHNEDWKHILTCNSPPRSMIRKKCILEFESALHDHNTYPPLAEFILSFISENDFNPEEPSIINPRYCLLFHQAYHRQQQIGWENFSRGFIAFDWKCIQYRYLVENKTKDIHAVDKWARMVIKNLLEYHRIMWKHRCDAIANENEFSYEGRQRKDMYLLCLYLKSHPDELLSQDHHYVDKTERFFTHSPFDSVVMWKNRIEQCMVNKNPDSTPIPKEKNSIKRHFRIKTNKRNRGRPKKKPSPKSKKTKTTSTPAPKSPQTKKARIQSSMISFFSQKQQQSSENNESQKLNIHDLEMTTPAFESLVPTSRKKKLE